MNQAKLNQTDVLVLAPFGRDSVLVESVLRESGINVCVAEGVREIVQAVPEHVGVAIIAEEALNQEDIKELAQRLEAQPPWSDFPIIVLTGGGGSTAATEVAVRSRAPLGNVALLERPLRPATLISAVRSALAARRRQYEIRDHLQKRQMAEEALRSARDALETIVEERTTALRHLSAQLLRVQDDERRRIARELHDSLGQYLAAAKIHLDMVAFNRGDRETYLADIRELLDRAISETRTLSHLLHPPLLDTAGFASAASWYVEGFGKRSGIRVSLAMPENLNRLSEGIETALFRIMQEALTNVHRHSGSTAVDIALTTDDYVVTLTIRDFGQGIPKEILESFSHSGTKVGVGLAGIRERVKELGGILEVESGKGGTTLKARIPMCEKSGIFAGNASSQMYSSLAS